MVTRREQVRQNITNKRSLAGTKTPVSTIQAFSNSPIAVQQPVPTANIPANVGVTPKGLPSIPIQPIAPIQIQPPAPIQIQQQQQQQQQLPQATVPPPPNVMAGQQTGLIQPVQNVGENRVNTAVQGIEGLQPFNYDYNNDPGYTAARDASLTHIKNVMGAAGRLYSGRTDQLMTEAAMNTALPFRQQAYNEYLGNTKNTYDKLSAFTGAEDRIRNQEIQQYGTALTPVARQYKTVYESMPPEMLNQVRAYRQDYAAEILRREKINKNDPLLPYLYAARTMKIMSSPDLMGKYAQDIGISAPGIATMALAYDAQVMKNEVDKIAMQYAGPKAAAEMEKIYAEVDRAVAEKDVKILDAAIKKLELANLPEELKLKIKEKIADIAYKNAAAFNQTTAGTENLARADLATEQKTTEKAKQLKELADANKAVKTSFDYEGFDRFDKYIQDTYMEDVTSVYDVAGMESTVSEDGGGFAGTPDTKDTAKSKRIKTGAHKALAAYLSRLKANPDVDQDIVAALMAKYPIDTVVGGKKEVLK